MFRDYIEFSVNGKVHRLKEKNAFLPLSDILRYELGLTGTKVVCAEGDCGACTVLFRRFQSGGASPQEVKKVSTKKSKVGTKEPMATAKKNYIGSVDSDKKFRSLNSCIASGILLDGCHLVTIEGLSSGKEKGLCEIQESMVRNFGSQCGFCTPGFVMSMQNMFEHKTTKVSEKNVKNYLTGNLCRCTGYSPIIDAALDVDISKVSPTFDLYDFSELSLELEKSSKKSIKISWGEKEFFAPTNMKLAVQYLHENPNCRIFSGATDLGVQINKGKDFGNRYLSLHLVENLYQISSHDDWIQIGARVTLDELADFSEKEIPELEEFLRIFASPQIKNTATLIGNIANGSPIGDTLPFFLSAEAELLVRSVDGVRTVALDEFYLDYKKFNLEKGEIIEALRFRKENTLQAKIGLYKVSQRRDLDISCVNSSFIVKSDKDMIESAKIAYGGVGPIALRLRNVEDFLVGRKIDRDLINETKTLISLSIAPISDVRGTSDFRSMMAQSLFEKFSVEHLGLGS